MSPPPHHAAEIPPPRQNSARLSVAHRDLIEQMGDPTYGRTPLRSRDIEQTLTVQSPGGDKASFVADLYIKTMEGKEWYFKVDTAYPDEDRCKALKRFTLQVAAIRKSKGGEGFAALPIASWEGPAKDGKIKQFLEVGTDMLVGREFWTKIGDEHTYDELLAIAENVGQEVRSLLG